MSDYATQVSPRKELPFIDGVYETYWWCQCGGENSNGWFGPFKTQAEAIEEGTSTGCQHSHLVMQCKPPTHSYLRIGNAATHVNYPWTQGELIRMQELPEYRAPRLKQQSDEEWHSHV